MELVRAIQHPEIMSWIEGLMMKPSIDDVIGKLVKGNVGLSDVRGIVKAFVGSDVNVVSKMPAMGMALARSDYQKLTSIVLDLLNVPQASSIVNTMTDPPKLLATAQKEMAVLADLPSRLLLLPKVKALQRGDQVDIEALFSDVKALLPMTTAIAPISTFLDTGRIMKPDETKLYQLLADKILKHVHQEDLLKHPAYVAYLEGRLPDIDYKELLVKYNGLIGEALAFDSIVNEAKADGADPVAVLKRRAKTFVTIPLVEKALETGELPSPDEVAPILEPFKPFLPEWVLTHPAVTSYMDGELPSMDELLHAAPSGFSAMRSALEKVVADTTQRVKDSVTDAFDPDAVDTPSTDLNGTDKPVDGVKASKNASAKGSIKYDYSKIVAERYRPTVITGNARVGLAAVAGFVFLLAMVSVLQQVLQKDARVQTDAIEKLNRKYPMQPIPDDQVKTFMLNTLPSAIVPTVIVATLAFNLPFILELFTIGSGTVDTKMYIKHAKACRGPAYVSLIGFALIALANTVFYITRTRLIRRHVSAVTGATLKWYSSLRMMVVGLSTTIAMVLIMLTCFSVVARRM